MTAVDLKLAELFYTGHVIDLILLLVVLEAGGIAAFRSWTGRGPALASVAPMLLSGAALLMALRLALARAPWLWIAACLACALVAHLLDLLARWRH